VHVEASSDKPLATDADTVAFAWFEGEPATDLAAPEPLRALAACGEARPGLGEVALAHDGARRLILVGAGERARFDGERARHVAAAAHGRAEEISARALCWALPQGSGADTAAALVQGTLLHAYRFDRYRPSTERLGLGKLIIAGPGEIAGVVARAALLAQAQNRARDLGNTAANDLPPAALAGYARELASSHPELRVEVLDESEIRERGMGAFAAVAQGSAQQARLIRLEYDGPGSDGAPRLALIGKGVTFDAGGLALKPSGSMHEMKFDMAGGAAVIEAVAALAELRAPVRVLGLIGATENLPSGRAVKPGDVVRALDGTTIQVDNPDAEGRLVLADCICLARSEGAERIVDIATLTGAIVTALGSHYAGLMSNDDGFAELVGECGRAAGEPVWRLPLDEAYARMVEGRYAQLTNRAERREAQAITAAELLHHFAGGVPWAHLDIAGTAYDVPRPYLRGKGATGFGVRLLVEVALAASAPGAERTR
jgi:leucyl aminopeptidase